MTVKGMATCAHCRALISTPICPICGKSEHDEVEIEDAGPIRRRGLSAEDRRRVIGFGAFLATTAAVVAITYVLLNREPAEPVPTALAAPTETTSTIRTEGDAPTVTRPPAPAEPLPTFETGAEREVGTGSNPWRGDVPRNVLNGELLPDADYGPGIDAVADLLAAAPPAWTFTTPETTEAGGVDLEAAETSQPFAARAVTDENGALGDLWVFARGQRSDDASAALLDEARSRWPIDEALDSFSPKAGVRIHLIADDGNGAVWVDDRPDAVIVFLVGPGTDPARIGGLAAAWR